MWGMHCFPAQMPFFVNLLKCKVEIICKLIFSAFYTQVINVLSLVCSLQCLLPPVVSGLVHSLMKSLFHSFVKYL